MSFLNVRHWSVIEDLRDGHFYAIVRRLFARPEMETLLAASFYKEVSFLPVWREAPQGVIERLEAAGFENLGRDLEAKFWLCRARRTSDEVAPLKECFTPTVRRTLVTLLRRLEYGIEVEENAAALWQLCREEGIFLEYLVDFAAQTIVHRRISCTCSYRRQSRSWRENLPRRHDAGFRAARCGMYCRNLRQKV